MRLLSACAPSGTGNIYRQVHSSVICKLSLLDKNNNYSIFLSFLADKAVSEQDKCISASSLLCFAAIHHVFLQSQTVWQRQWRLNPQEAVPKLATGLLPESRGLPAGETQPAVGSSEPFITVSTKPSGLMSFLHCCRKKKCGGVGRVPSSPVNEWDRDSWQQQTEQLVWAPLWREQGSRGRVAY